MRGGAAGVGEHAGTLVSDLVEGERERPERRVLAEVRQELGDVGLVEAVVGEVEVGDARVGEQGRRKRRKALGGLLEPGEVEGADVGGGGQPFRDDGDEVVELHGRGGLGAHSGEADAVEVLVEWERSQDPTQSAFAEDCVSQDQTNKKRGRLKKVKEDVDGFGCERTTREIENGNLRSTTHHIQQIFHRNLIQFEF